MRSVFRCVFVLFIASAMSGELQAGPDSTTASSRIRAVWASTLSPCMNSPKEIRELVVSARRANMNTIIAQVRHRGIVYYKSAVEPTAPLLARIPDFDPLETLLREAHDTSGGKARLQVYAWFNVFKLGTVEGSRAASRKYREWQSRDTTGSLVDFLDPAVPEVQDHLLSLVEECVRGYDVDGVNLDYVRYPEEDAGYHERALERFRLLSGATGVPTAHDAKWNSFRRDQVSAFVRRCAVTVWKHRPNAMFSVDAVGFGGAPKSEFGDSAPYRQVHQDWAGWLNEGYIDLVCRMGYKRESVPAQAAQFRGWADFSRRLQDANPGQLVTVGIGGYLNTLEETLAQYREAEARGLGTSIFSYWRPLKDGGGSGSASQFWTALSEKVYTRAVAPPEPWWRQQCGIIAGVARRKDGKPMDGEKIILSSGKETTTDGSGFFMFSKVVSGRYTVRAMDAKTATADVQAGQIVELAL